MPSPFASVLSALAQAFDAVGARWYLFGAQAALLHGVALFTADIDVTAGEHGTKATAKAKASFELAAAGIEAAERWRQAERTEGR